MLALRGERYRVVGERGGPAGMWRLEGGKSGLSANCSRFGRLTNGLAVSVMPWASWAVQFQDDLRTIPKTHVKEGGWRWAELSEWPTEHASPAV